MQTHTPSGCYDVRPLKDTISCRSLRRVRGISYTMKMEEVIIVRICLQQCLARCFWAGYMSRFAMVNEKQWQEEQTDAECSI